METTKGREDALENVTPVHVNDAGIRQQNQPHPTQGNHVKPKETLSRTMGAKLPEGWSQGNHWISAHYAE